MSPLKAIAAVAAGFLVCGLVQVQLPAAGASTPDPAFRAMNGFRPTESKARLHPERFRAIRVDSSQVRSDLRSAPKAGSSGATIFRVPTPSGGMERFAVQRTEVMQARLAAAHPELQTWSG